MYARQSHIIRYNLSKCFSTLTLAPTRCYSTKHKDDFKILQVPESIRRKKDHLPGIEKRKKYLQGWDEAEALGHNENEAISTNIDPEEFHAMQADFMNLDESYNSHQKEILLKRKLKERSQMRKKHFKEAKQPKLLTVTDMHQIKVLHEQDPDEWTVDKLSMSFPATPSIIIKVLKSNTPRSSERMKEHDTEVKHNWALLQTGQLTGLSPDYEHHLSMFSYRDPVVRTMGEYKQFQPPIHKYVPESTEFRSIITSYYDMVKMKKKLKTCSDNDTNSIVGTDMKQLTSSEHVIETKKETRLLTNESTKQIHANLTNKYVGNNSHVKQIQGNIANKNNLTVRIGNNIIQDGSLARRFSTFRSYLAARITPEDSTTNITDIKESNSNEVEQSQVVDQLDASNRSHLIVNAVSATDKEDENVVSSDKIDVSHVFETETSTKEESRNKESINEGSTNKESNTFDKNRTMFSDRPKHWRQIERHRIEEEMEKERNKREAMADRTTHDGQWRKLARNQRQDYTTDLDIEAFNSSQNNPKETRGLRDNDDDDDMDIDAFNSRNRNSVETRGNGFHSRRNNRVESEGFDSRESDDWDIDRFNSRSNADANSESLDSRLSSEVSEDAESTQDSSPASTNDSSSTSNVSNLTSNSNSNSSRSTFDRDRRMYPTKPDHWVEIVRQREMNEREKKMVAMKLDEERSDRSAYDGQWRRLRHRREGHSSERRSMLEKQIDARIASLRERRMDTMSNSEEELSEEKTLSQSSQQEITHRENTVGRSSYERDSRHATAGGGTGETNEGKNV
uniref:Neurite outgrowth-associated protein n=1 Tax=Cacopsylla melanoneura TaxID=428564 RepID=A0A8D9AWL4_9HEMI